MKYCSHCGSELMDEAYVCPHCGCLTEAQVKASDDKSVLRTVVKVFMLLSCVTAAFAFLLPLCWVLPMTIHYWKCAENNINVGMGFKICTLIFVNVIAGVLMLVENDI